MPICKKCNNSFPIWVVIEGKKRNLSNRKYCLDCSPFGSNNRKNLEKNVNELEYEKLKCSICGRVYDYNYKDKVGHSKKRCNSCIVNQRRFKLKEKMAKYKGGKCVKCGYDKNIKALQFHHKNPEVKSFNLSGSHCYNWERIKEELDKTILLCANCHIEEHDKIYQQSIDYDNRLDEDLYILNQKPKYSESPCPICGSEDVLRNGTYCSHKCRSIGTAKVKNKPSDGEILKLVEENGYSGTGRMFNVTGNAVKKWVKKINKGQ